MRKVLLIAAISFTASVLTEAQAYVRINQVGYLPSDKKAAMLMTNEPAPDSFL
jgi:hypothetical protein